MKPEPTEEWLSSGWTWLVLLGVFLVLCVAVRLLGDLIDYLTTRYRREDKPEGEDPWRWT